MYATAATVFALAITGAVADITFTAWSGVKNTNCAGPSTFVKTYKQGVCNNFVYDVYSWTAPPAAGNKQTVMYTGPDCTGDGATWHFATTCLDSEPLTAPNKNESFASFMTYN